jgi:hypothetical protein
VAEAVLANKIGDKLKSINDRLAEISSFSDLAPALLKEKEELEKKKNILTVCLIQLDDNNSNENKIQQGGNVADDTTQTAEVAAELAKIEARLKEISGYQFLPPSIKQEKEQLNKRKVELVSLQHQFENEQLTTGPGQGSSPPVSTSTSDSAPPPKSEPVSTKIEVKSDPELPSEEGSAIAPTFAKATVDKKATADKEKSNLIGSNYAVDGGDGGSIEEKIADGDDEKDKKEEASLVPRSEESSLLKEIEFSGKSSDALQKAQKMVASFKQALSDSDSPDKDYLKSIVDKFAEMIDGLTEKAKKAGMDDKTKEKAIKGRLAIYIKSIESEFEFSELLDSNLKNQIKELVG